MTESARRLTRWTDVAESRGRSIRQGVVMLISGVKGSLKPTKHLPLLVLLDEHSSVSNKRPYASRPRPTSPLYISENVLLRAPNDITCPHMYTPPDCCPPPHHGCVTFFFFFLFLFNTRITKKDPPPVTSLVWYFKHDKMFWLIC